MTRALDATHLEQTPMPSPRGLDEEAKRSFLRMISHELRTPLNSIIGFSEVLRQQPHGPMPAEYLEYAAIIGDSGTKMLRMVNQIVEIVRLENEAAELDIHPEPLESLIEEVLLSLRQESRALDVRLAAEAPEAMPWVHTDPRALKTVLSNLLHNAMAHAPVGDVVTVRAMRTGDQVSIEIEDHGPGVDPQDVQRLLRPFQKGGSHGRGPDGAGLGLPIALLYSRALGGDLDIRTAPGQGFTAIVTAPAA
jgi:signal transduction histidine kinase